MQTWYADVTAAQNAANANVDVPDVVPAGHQATLPLSPKWSKETFPRVEPVREAKRQTEYEFG